MKKKISILLLSFLCFTNLFAGSKSDSINNCINNAIVFFKNKIDSVDVTTFLYFNFINSKYKLNINTNSNKYREKLPLQQKRIFDKFIRWNDSTYDVSNIYVKSESSNFIDFLIHSIYSDTRPFTNIDIDNLDKFSTNSLNELNNALFIIDMINYYKSDKENEMEYKYANKIFSEISNDEIFTFKKLKSILVLLNSDCYHFVTDSMVNIIYKNQDADGIWRYHKFKKYFSENEDFYNKLFIEYNQLFSLWILLEYRKIYL